jgi:hypothetical protein
MKLTREFPKKSLKQAPEGYFAGKKAFTTPILHARKRLLDSETGGRRQASF